MLSFCALDFSSYAGPILELGSFDNMVRSRTSDGHHEYQWVYKDKVFSVEHYGTEGVGNWYLRVIKGGTGVVGTIGVVSLSHDFRVNLCGKSYNLDRNTLPCLSNGKEIKIISLDSLYGLSFEREEIFRSEYLTEDYKKIAFFTGGRILELRNGGCALIFEVGVALIDVELKLVKMHRFEKLIQCVDIQESYIRISPLSGYVSIDIDLSPIL